ncbi:MAG: VWA domain-containing protein [Planctomycetes bacterium]|jgi:Mg-chelatase subunit ChlD|nr:VWA domain-containing protein [Planctomycetota bacterium]
MKRLSILMTLNIAIVALSSDIQSPGKFFAAYPRLSRGIMLCLAAPAAAAEPHAVESPEPVKQPQIEVAFVLDTTGSMSGLIEAAKRKIWYLANEMTRAEPKPVVRMALVGYRDKSDAYVTKVHDLTDNIDQVYADLRKFSASGGGDTPENVNQGLHDAINKLQWSEDKDALKIIYLVGDCPPHNEYKDVPTYQELSTKAITKGIYINTILCGGSQDTAKVWKEIARRAEGRFVAIDQDGGVQHITTPYDKELAKLNSELTGTVVVYGNVEAQTAARELNAAAASMPAAADKADAAAERAKYAAKSGRVGTNDLVQAVADGEVELADVKDDLLSPEMQKMSPEERKQHIAAQQDKRKDLNAKIVKLSKQRDEYIREERAKQAEAGKKAGFDAEVVEALHEQAARKKIEYKVSDTE